jgi:hypothetical protein
MKNKKIETILDWTVAIIGAAMFLCLGTGIIFLIVKVLQCLTE